MTELHVDINGRVWLSRTGSPTAETLSETELEPAPEKEYTVTLKLTREEAIALREGLEMICAVDECENAFLTFEEAQRKTSAETAMWAGDEEARDRVDELTETNTKRRVLAEAIAGRLKDI